MEQKDGIALAIAVIVLVALLPFSMIISVELVAFYVLWKHFAKKKQEEQEGEINEYVEAEFGKVWSVLRTILRKIDLRDIRNHEDLKTLEKIKKELHLREYADDEV